MQSDWFMNITEHRYTNSKTARHLGMLQLAVFMTKCELFRFVLHMWTS